MKWIPCEKKLPCVCEDVLGIVVYTNWRGKSYRVIEIVNRDSEKQWRSSFGEDCLTTLRVTHWCPIPELPDLNS